MTDQTRETDAADVIADVALSLLYIVLVGVSTALWIAFARAEAWALGGCALLLGVACAIGFERHVRRVVKR